MRDYYSLAALKVLPIKSARKLHHLSISEGWGRSPCPGRLILHLQSKNRVIVPQMNLKFPSDMKAP